MIHIGPYAISNTLFLAPMAGVTDSIFRSICVQNGAGYIVSEMVSSDTTLHNSDKTRHRLRRAECELPHVVQIVGSEPSQLAQAAQYNVAQGAQIIDINMGCPAKKVCNKLAGSALLSDEKRVDAILSAVVKSVNVPVTLKIRTGADPARRNGVTIARIAQRNGIQALAVHGRTRADRFRGQAEFDTIAAIKQAVDIPVIANGDIRSATDAAAVLDYTRADGLMIGRAAQGNPWIFRQIGAALDGAGSVPAPDDTEVHRTLTQHVRALHNLYGEFRGLRIARKHISWYCKNKRGAAAFRNIVNGSESAQEQLALIDQFFARPDSFATAGAQHCRQHRSKPQADRTSAADTLSQSEDQKNKDRENNDRIKKGQIKGQIKEQIKNDQLVKDQSAENHSDKHLTDKATDNNENTQQQGTRHTQENEQQDKQPGKQPGRRKTRQIAA